MSNLSVKLLLCLYVIVSTCQGNPSVTISQGALEGLDLTTQNGRTIFGFLGIPYAQPPLGDLRFKAPLPASSWSDTYNATDWTSECIQVRGEEVVGDEDCLYLNVYTPQLPEGNTALLAVMVFIHGGGFSEGSARIDLYGPEFILDNDVVLVTINYRLGPLGFLTTGDQEAPGNFGLKDQILALRWVQDNIAAFGGDSDHVTIFGNSAGSACVHMLTLSDLTEGLFHKFILQSGTAINPTVYRERSEASLVTKEFAESFNCSTNNSSTIVKCLREQDAASLISCTPTVNGIAFIPTNEPESDQAVFTDSPKSIIEQGKMRDLPWICGVTSDEGLLQTASYIIDESQWDNFLDNLNNSIDSMVDLLGVDDVTEYTSAIRNYYFNDLNADKDLILQNYTDFMGDYNFVYPTVNLLQTQTRIGTQAAYMYLFDYQGTISTTYELTHNATVLGTCHGDDIFYLFLRSHPYFVPLDRNMTETDLEMMKRLTGLWTSFAIHGVPTLTGVEDADDWLKFDEETNYLRIGNEADVSLVVESALFEDRMHFWDGLIGSSSSGGSGHASFSVITLIVTLFMSYYFIK